MAATWHVTGQNADQFEWDGAGNPVTGYRVSFVTGNGNRGSVFIPVDKYTDVKGTRAVIQQQANLMDEVGTLASSG